jgi:hypothetical protein
VDDHGGGVDDQPLDAEDLWAKKFEASAELLFISNCMYRGRRMAVAYKLVYFDKNQISDTKRQGFGVWVGDGFGIMSLVFSGSLITINLVPNEFDFSLEKFKADLSKHIGNHRIFKNEETIKNKWRGYITALVKDSVVSCFEKCTGEYRSVRNEMKMMWVQFATIPKLQQMNVRIGMELMEKKLVNLHTLLEKVRPIVTAFQEMDFSLNAS